jgi:hypothetical protein
LFAACGRIGSNASVAVIVVTLLFAHGVVPSCPNSRQPVVAYASFQDIVSSLAEQLVLTWLPDS